tara:strand:- start:244 stop:2733 length:2490 start_codon:yes stop_codon:yes gene_type:complete
LTHSRDRFTTHLILGVFFASGAAGLIYEILWMRQLAQLFGSTSQSAAVTTAAFFIGISAGSYYWGQRAAQLDSPLRTYAWLEFGIVVAGLFFYLLFQAYFWIYGAVFATFAGTGIAFTLIKGLLAMLLICPASFLMGGTLPLMGEHLIQDRQQLGRWAGTLYGINTLGAVAGAIAAGFFLPRWLGINLTYGLALLLSLSLGASAWMLARRGEFRLRPESTTAGAPNQTRSNATAPITRFALLECVALASGFLSLAMQVLWIRMFVQVLQNSTYTFSAVLVVFLSALALGALAVRAIISRVSANMNTLLGLMALAGGACLVTPVVFVEWTNGLTYLGNRDTLGSYLFQVFFAVGLIVGMPTLLMGMVLPYLYRYAEEREESAGKTLGRLNGWNTSGAVIGPLAASFLLLPAIGLWSSVLLLGLAYLAFPLVLLRSARARLATVSGVALLLFVANPATLPTVRVQDTERVLALWEGSDGTVAVVERDGKRRIKLNNWYALGGSGAMRMEQIQTHLPMHLHPNPKAVFYLGMGSGITAGTVLNYPIDRAVVTELSAEVIEASAQYFGEYSNSFHEHPAVTVVHEDGRNFLAGTRESFDLIIADLFVPWRAGVALLYTRDHFERSRARLNPGGLFVQWIPLYQISERELKIVAKTMTRTFPLVTLWRGDFYAEKPILALVGHVDDAPLEPTTHLVERSRQDLTQFRIGQGEQIPLTAYYLGSLDPSSAWMSDSPINTDNLPIIEYLAPESHRAERAAQINWFTGEDMIGFMQYLQQTREPSADPYLGQLSPDMHQAVYAGLFFHIAAVARSEDKLGTAANATAVAKSLLAAPR